MNAVLSVIGTIFMVLLIIVLVLLLLVCFLLFCPVCYKAEAEFKETLFANGRVCWLLGLVWVTFAFQDGEFTSKIQLFGMDLQKISAWRQRRKKKVARKKQSKEKVKSHSNKEETKKLVRSEQSEVESEPKQAEERMLETEPETKAIAESERLQESLEEKEAKKPEKVKRKNRILRLWQRMKELIQSIKTFFQSLALFRKKIRQKIDWAKALKKFWKSANTKRMVCILKDNVIHLWRKLKPKVLRGSIIFGTGDPCSTGEILGVAAIFYAAYGQGIQVTPDFEVARLEGNLFLKGRISLITIVIILIRVFLSGEWSRFRKEAEQLKEAF